MAHPGRVHAGGVHALDRPGGRLRVRTLARLRWETAVVVLLAADIGDRPAADPGGARAGQRRQRLQRRAGVVDVRRASPLGEPEAAVAVLLGQQPCPSVRAGTDTAAARSARIPNVVRLTAPPTDPSRVNLARSIATRSWPPKSVALSPAARATRMLRSSEPASVAPAARSR